MKSKNGIIGVAVADALGVPVEFKSRKELKKNPITDMIGNGTYNMPKGTWSDDTSMTLATIDSIIQKGNIDTNDIADKFLNWFRKSEYTATGKTFDIGRTTLQALAKYELKIDVANNCGEDDEYSNGNGSLMRMLPIAYYCFSKQLKDKEILELVKEVSSITHKHEVSILGCYIYVKFAIELLNGNNKELAYQNIKRLKYDLFEKCNIQRYERIIENDIKIYSEDEIKSTGYVVDTLEAVLWLFLNFNDYNKTVLKAINLGDDTDTVGACVGGLAGIYYGIENINTEWKSNLIKYDYIVNICNKFDEILEKYRNINKM